ncbi:MAG TPA: hypothetical protein VNF68_15685 [Candidatus Baltobacteraceae bacterium]|nr:hypothetical protein [Candidatus Baltobacteraceae bacterium]
MQPITIRLLDPAKAQYGYRAEDEANQRVARSQNKFLRDAMSTTGREIQYIAGADDFAIDGADDQVRKIFERAIFASGYRAMYVERFGRMTLAETMDAWALPAPPEASSGEPAW